MKQCQDCHYFELIDDLSTDQNLGRCHGSVRAPGLTFVEKDPNVDESPPTDFPMIRRPVTHSADYCPAFKDREPSDMQPPDMDA